MVKNERNNVVMMPMRKRIIFLLFLLLSPLTYSATFGLEEDNFPVINLDFDSISEDRFRGNGSVYYFSGDVFGSLEVQKDNFLIDGKGFSLKGSGSGTGILVENKRNVTIQNLHIEGFNDGVRVNSSTGICLLNNTLTANNGQGLLLAFTNNSIIRYNQITENNRGIRAFSSSNNTVFGNNMSFNVLSGIGFEAKSNNNMIYDNLIEKNSRYGIWLFDNSNNNKVFQNTIKQSLYGILLPQNSNFNQITQNTLTNNSLGLWIDGSSSNKIQENTITNNGDGGWLYSSSNNNQVTRNTIADNQYGFLIYNNSQSNHITENNIKNNSIGIWLSESSYNRIYHNNFYNTRQILSENSTNFWDNGYPSGGNYWSDYMEKYPETSTTGNLGIGNIAYVIDQNNKDNYPLINPYFIQPEPTFPSSWIITFSAIPIFVGAFLLVFYWRKKRHITSV
jgi:parallel beta-helix repeat protein